MDVKPTRGLLRYFDQAPDPRAADVSFSLTSLLTMTLLAVLRRQALNPLRKHPPPRHKHGGSPSVRVSLKRRRLLCSLDEQYLLQTFLPQS